MLLHFIITTYPRVYRYINTNFVLAIVCTDFHFYFYINEITPRRNVVIYCLKNYCLQQNKMNPLYLLSFSF